MHYFTDGGSIDKNQNRRLYETLKTLLRGYLKVIIYDLFTTHMVGNLKNPGISEVFSTTVK